MQDTQKTISIEGSISGVGLHTGTHSQVFFKPAAAGAGIHFFKKGVFVGALGLDYPLFLLDDTARCSAIGRDSLRILTVEHVLAAIYGLGISNLIVDVHGDEIPGLDGSAMPFVGLIKRLGILDQKEPRFVYALKEPVFCHQAHKAIAMLPSERFEICYTLDYDYPYLRAQKAEFVISSEVFEAQIAPCRTFCTVDEASELKQRGFGLGGTAENNIVVSPDGSHVKGLRFENECARHKILDVVGDLSLLGFPVLGKVIAIRSGHSLNRQLAQAIRKQMMGNDQEAVIGPIGG